jgi:hypothetical protein
MKNGGGFMALFYHMTAILDYTLADKFNQQGYLRARADLQTHPEP